MRNFYNLTFLIFITISLGAQNQKHILGMPCKDCSYSQKSGPFTVQNGSGTIATSYTTTACGLNFTQASVRLNKRVFSMPTPTGVAQPATYSISGIPACAVIEKAFLYTSVSGNGVPITATITNPFSTTSNFSMAIIGNHIDKCWGFAGTFSYRADVTSIISGNGNYIISGIPTGTVNNDADGATLFIIYRDPTQNYTGSIVIADGCFVAQGGITTASINGFNVCGTTSLTTSFALVGDLQQLASTGFQFNSGSVNYTLAQPSQNIWDFVMGGGSPATSGQTSAIYGVNNSGDCFNFVMAGMYYRTNCNMCPIPTLSVGTVVSSSCTVGSATATPSGGLGPYTYTWSPTGGNTSVISGATIGTYTVTVKDASCAIGFATVAIAASPTVAVSNQTLCAGNTATLTASGATTYSWNTSATTSQIIVSPTVTTIYTITGANGPCTDTKTVSITVNASPTVNVVASNTIICAGQTTTLTASGGNSYLWSTGSTNTVIVVTPTSNVTYSVTGFVPGCSGTETISITVNAMPSVSVSSSNSLVCSGNSATLTVSGTATSYSWSTGATTSQIVVSPSVNTTYTVVGVNGVCSVSRTIAVTSGISPTMTAMTSNSFICAGQTVTLSAIGATSYTYNPGGITGNPIALSPTTSITYTVLGSNGGPCIGSSLITQMVSPCTDVDQLLVPDPEFGVFPNPTTGEFTLVLQNTYENCFVEVYNSIGQLIKKQNVKENLLKLNLNEQANGVYYLRIVIGGAQVQKIKVVKE